jgi:flagellar motor switch/type III secretory pathway protein FliN
MPSAGGEPPRPVVSPAQAEAARQAQGKSSPAKSPQAKPSQARSSEARPEPGRKEPGKAELGKAELGKAELGLIPAPQSPDEGEMGLPLLVTRLPVALDVVIPVRAFRVRHLLALAPGHLIETRWNHGEDMPIAAGNVQLAWSEFEVVDTQLAVRITRVA